MADSESSPGESRYPIYPGPLAQRMELAFNAWARQAVVEEIRRDYPNARRVDMCLPSFLKTKGDPDEQIRLALLILDYRLTQTEGMGHLLSPDPRRVEAGRKLIEESAARRASGACRTPDSRPYLKARAMLPIVRSVLDLEFGRPAEFFGKNEFDYHQPLEENTFVTSVQVGGMRHLDYTSDLWNFTKGGLLLRGPTLMAAFGWSGNHWAPRSEEEVQQACQTIVDFTRQIRAVMPRVLARARSDASPQDLLETPP